MRGVLAVTDTPRPSAATAVAALARRNLAPVMLTGDHERSARAVGEELGITEIHARLLPQDKAAFIDLWQEDGNPAAFIGDGVNDAPALAAASVGMGIGTGSDLAIETAEVTLMSGNPTQAVTAIDLARRTLRGIRQNLWWAFGYNVAAIPLAVAGLLDPMVASAAMGTVERVGGHQQPSHTEVDSRIDPPIAGACSPLPGYGYSQGRGDRCRMGRGTNAAGSCCGTRLRRLERRRRRGIGGAPLPHGARR